MSDVDKFIGSIRGVVGLSGVFVRLPFVALSCFVICSIIIPHVYGLTQTDNYKHFVTAIEEYSKNHVWQLHNIELNNIQRDDIMKLNIAHSFKQFIGDEPVFIYLCPTHGIPYQSIGNRLAVYFEYMAVSLLSGMHFLSPTVTFMLPKVVLNPNPATNRSDAIKMLSSMTVSQYPLAERNALWSEYIPIIINNLRLSMYDLIRQMFQTFQPFVQKSNFGLFIKGSEVQATVPRKWLLEDARNHAIKGMRNQDESQTTVLNSDDTAPLFADHVIHFRCSDILLGSPDGNYYGILNFYTFITIIPQNAQSIYIVSEPKNFAVYSHYCDKIVVGLAYFLNYFYPNANIAIHQGHMDEAMPIINQAKKTVTCSASTFCFWPQLASTAKAYHKRGVIDVYDSVNIRHDFFWLDRPKTARFDKVNMSSPSAVIDMLEILTYLGPEY